MEDCELLGCSRTTPRAKGEGMVGRETKHPSLLEQLRRGDVRPYQYQNRHSTVQALDLLVSHRSELPRSVQTFLGTLDKGVMCWQHLYEVYRVARALLLAKAHDHESLPSFHWELDDAGQIDPESRSEGQPWHGLDGSVDTEAQVETLVRFFPTLLTESFPTRVPGCGFRHAHPVHLLLSHERAVGFIPLLVKLGTELPGPGGFFVEERGGLRCGIRGLPSRPYYHFRRHNYNGYYNDLPKHLFCNLLARGLGGHEISPALDEASLQTLIRLVSEGWVGAWDVEFSSLLPWLLGDSSNRSVAYTERRLRLGICWNPRVLCWYSWKNWNPISLVSFCVTTMPTAVDPTLLETIVELGAQHFPDALGFVFYGDTFAQICDAVGSSRASAMVRKHLLPANQGRERIAWLAAHQLSLDGLYAVVRYDPVALLPQATTTES